MTQALEDLHYWEHLAPTIDYRVWTQARCADDAERVRQMRIKDCRRYIRYLKNAG